MTFLEEISTALGDAVVSSDKVFILGQLVKYGLGGLTEATAAGHPDRMLTFPVGENLMNAAAMGMALAGLRPIVIHERMDFLAVGMDPLVNHIPVWPARHPTPLPIVVIAIVGKGKGQGPQHSKNLTPWFRMMDGWKVVEPSSPKAAGESLFSAIFGNDPVLYVVHREFFNAERRVKLPRPSRIGLCGASARHERAFYRD